jgi:predicted flap endonuclease-1-like 5' DNA nuclease
MGASDGLRAIRGLGSVTAERLGEMGVTSCRQVAAWTPEDVRAVAEHIRVSPERIEREDWVGQARRLVGELETAKPQAG